MNRSLVFFLLAALAPSLAALVVYSSLKKKDEEIRRVRATTMPIVVAAHDIAVGARIDSGAVKLARWPRDNLPPAATTDIDSVIGRVARAEFVENQPIVSSRLLPGGKTSGILPLMIPPNMRAMSVAVDEVADMAGFVLPDTRVDVLLSLAATDKEPGRSKIVLENIQVLAVAQTLERKDNPQPERVVTLLLTPEEAERLAVAVNQGKLHLVLRGYGDSAVVTTAGSDVRKVMNAYSNEVPEPVPVRQESIPARFTPPRAVHYRTPQPLESVEVLRNGHSRDMVMIGPDGRAIAGNTVALESEPNSPSARAADLENDAAGPQTYQPGAAAPDDGMTAAGAAFNDGGSR